MHARTQVPLLHYIGIDVSKAFLQIHWIPTASCLSLPGRWMGKLPAKVDNSPKGHAQLIGWIRRLQDHLGIPVQVICEATGGYQAKLLQACWMAGILISQINPRQGHHFAKGAGRLAKTDKIDAATLADFGASLRPKPTSAPSKALQQLTGLVNYRDQLQTRLQVIENQLEHLQHPELIAHAQKQKRRLKADIKDFDARIAKAVASDHQLHAMSHCMQQVKGVGELTAAKLLVHAPELGTLGRKQAASLTGLAPINRDSGTLRGHRHIAHGRPKARQALYMSALVASKRNPVLSEFYNRLLQRGKPKKVALTAVMHKLLLNLNSLMRPIVSQSS